MKPWEAVRWAILALPARHDRLLRVLLVLVSHADNDTGIAWPSRRTIAAEAYGGDVSTVTKSQERQVQRALHDLELHGAIERLRTGSGSRPSSFRLRWDEKSAATASPARPPEAGTTSGGQGDHAAEVAIAMPERAVPTSRTQRNDAVERPPATAAEAQQPSETHESRFRHSAHRPNRYEGPCLRCGNLVEAGQGTFASKEGGGYGAVHLPGKCLPPAGEVNPQSRHDLSAAVKAGAGNLAGFAIHATAHGSVAVGIPTEPQGDHT